MGGGVHLKLLQVSKDCRQAVVTHLKPFQRGVEVLCFGNKSGMPPGTCLFSHVPVNESKGEHEGFYSGCLWKVLVPISSM
jgi:hypothetical protein